MGIEGSFVHLLLWSRNLIWSNGSVNPTGREDVYYSRLNDTSNKSVISSDLLYETSVYRRLDCL